MTLYGNYLDFCFFFVVVGIVDGYRSGNFTSIFVY